VCPGLHPQRIILATKSILGLDTVTDGRLLTEIANRLGIFCYSFLDYDRAVELFEVSLAAAERTGDAEKIHRQLTTLPTRCCSPSGSASYPA